MKANLVKQRENRVEFVVDGIGTTFSNLIRRYLLSSVEVMAIDAVTFYDNNSSFWDEYLAHRLGLIPLTTPAKLPKETEVILTLDAEGPKVVYAEEMKSNDDGVVPSRPKIPLLTLGQNQRIRFEAKAKIGTARTHSKYQAGLMSYHENNGKMNMFVETFNQMPVKDIIKRTCTNIIEQLEEIEAEVK
ncbi:DNA-directed RNA polymerase subunit D [Candidatus Micrarchaeota archaeon]|nr:DNA-directed RNA polymerase subunit D [Candidatus Micrarchaeota archaeon]